MVCPRPSVVSAVGRVPKVHAVAPVFSNGWAIVDDGPGLLATWRLSTPRSSSSASTSPWSTMRKCGRRWVARPSGRKARAVVSLPRGWRPLPTVRGGSASWIERRQDLLGGLGIGTRGRRAVFGSVRKSSMTSSFRSAGTSQRNGASSTRATTSSGTSMVMPSSGAAGSNV